MYTFTMEDFGADLPENWEVIAQKLTDISERNPDIDSQEIWEAYWDDINDRENLENAVDDWWADHENEPEYDDFIIDGLSLDDDKQWYMAAHDSKHTYELRMNTEGNIYIV